MYFENSKNPNSSKKNCYPMLPYVFEICVNKKNEINK